MIHDSEAGLGDVTCEECEEEWGECSCWECWHRCFAIGVTS